MLNGPLFGPMLRFTLPIMAMGVLQVLYNSADIIIVGQFAAADSPAVASIGATAALINLIVAVFINLSIGINVALSMALGRGDDRASHEIVHTSMVIAGIAGVILVAIGYFCSEQFLIWMDCPADVLGGATLYMKIYFAGMPASLIYNFGSAILKSKGDTKRPLYILVIAGLVNVLLNIIFVAVVGMEVDGVALATVISQTMSATAVAIMLMKEKGCCKLVLSKLHIYGDKAWLIIKYGVPAGLSSVMFNISNVFLQSSVNSFNLTDVITGVTAAGSLDSLTSQAINSFGQATITFTGQNVGAGNEDRIPKILKCSATMTFAISLFLGCILFFFGPEFIRLYAPNAPDAAVEYGMQRIRVTQIFYFIVGFNEVIMGSLRGMGYSTTPTVILTVCICIFRIIWILTVFPIYHNITGLFTCYPVSWTLSSVAMAAAYYIIMKKRKKTLSHIRQ